MTNQSWQHRSRSLCLRAINLGLSVGLGINLIFGEQPCARAASIHAQQTPTVALQDDKLIAAQNAFTEAERLRAQGTADFLQQAIKKYEESLSLFRAAGDRSKEALTLNAIGRAYTDLGENGKAIEYLSQALTLFKSIGDRGREATVLYNLGVAYVALGDLKKAQDYCDRALPLFKEANDRAGEASALNNLGAIYKLQGSKRALAYYQQALSLRQAANDRAGEAVALNNLGSAYDAFGEWPKALDYYQQALTLWRSLEDRRGAATALTNLGWLYAAMGEKPKALDYFDQALPLWRLTGDGVGERRILNFIRQLDEQRQNQQMQMQAKLQHALMKLEQINLERTGNSNARRWLASHLARVGSLYADVGDLNKAIVCYRLALNYWRGLKDHTEEARLLKSLSIALAGLGRKEEMQNIHTQLLAFSRSSGDRTAEAKALVIISSNYFTLGERINQADYLQQAISIVREVRDRKAEARLLSALGLTYHNLGETQKSLDVFRDALRLYGIDNNRHEEASTLTSIGIAYASLGEYQQALDYYDQAMSLFRSLNDETFETRALRFSAVVRAEMGEYQKALEICQRVLALRQAKNDRVGEVRTHTQIGAIYIRMNEPQKSLDHNKQALWLWRYLGDTREEAITLGNLGAAYAALGEYQKALDHYLQAFLVFRTVGDRKGEATALYGVARVESARSNLKQARVHIEAALKIIESLRAQVTNREVRSSYFASVQNYFEFYIGLLMRLHQSEPTAGHLAAAFQASERARARNLLELLTEARADIRSGVAPALLERERSTQQRLNDKAAAQFEMLAAEHREEQAAALAKEIQSLTADYQEIAAQIRATSPRYAALTQPQPLTTAEIQQRVLDADTLLLEYSLGEERSFLWAVTPTGISSYELPKREIIEAAAQRVYGMLTLPNRSARGETEKQRILRQAETNEQFSTAAAELSRMLLTPVAQQLGKKRLVFVADGALHYLPFGALPDPNSLNGKASEAQPLIVEHEIVNLPSASTLAVLRRELAGRKPAVKALAVLADPVFAADDERVKGRAQQPAAKPDESVDGLTQQRILQQLAPTKGGLQIERLPFTRQEAEQILALVPTGEGMKALDFEASRATALSDQLSQYRYVHFATHGLADSERPDLSTILLSLFDKQGKPQEGFLRAHEVYNLNLPAEMVVLSACETGLGKLTKGEGLVSLTRGFMYAGAARVVVSLWSVSDRATAELMTKFYRKILVEGERPAAALRAAQVEMWKDKRWAPPYYWAAFSLQGEWR